MSSSQIIGNNAGTAVPVAVDSSGNVRVSVSGPVSADLYADDGSGSVPVAGEATGELKAQALGTTSGGVLTPLLVDSQGRVVTSGGVTGPTGPAGQSSTFYPYRTNTTPGTGDPGTGLVSWDNTSQLLSTQIQINHIDQNNVDIDIFLALLSVGDTVTIQDRSNSANFQRWTVSGTPTSLPNYVQVPVTLSAGSWSAPNNHQIIVAFLNAGPVGPTGPTGATGPTGPTGATGTAAWPSTSSVLLAGDGSSVTVGTGLSLSAGTLTASGGGGSLPSPGVYTWDFSGASPYSNLGSGGTATLAATAGTSEQSAGLWSSGRKGLRAYALDSATGAINTTTLSIPWENTSFTIEMYLQVDFMRGITGLGGNSWIFSLNSTGFPNTGGGSAINLASGNYVLGLPAFQTSRPLAGIQDAQLLNGSVALRPMHVAFVLNRSNPTAVTLTFYVDGVVAGTSGGNNPRSLGAYGLYGGPFTTVQVFMGGAGIIGWLSLDNVAKTQAQLQANTLILKSA
jgi:hypothetical protein